MAFLISAGVQSNQARIAAQKQSDAQKKGQEYYRRYFRRQRAELEPWKQAGLGALGELQQEGPEFDVSTVQTDPGFDFRMQEGQKAIERSAAARGGLQTGGTLKALAQYGQGLASDEYGRAYERAYGRHRDTAGDRYRRLSGLANIGQSAVGSLTQAQQGYADRMAQSYGGIGQAQAASHAARGKAWGSAVGGLGQLGMDIYTGGGL